MIGRVILQYRGDALELPLGVTVVGRDLECSLRIHDPAVSRRHLRFIRRHREVFVEDLSSTNGTLLNGRPLFQPIRLHDDDLLQLGARELRVQFVDDETAEDLEPQTLVVGTPLAAPAIDSKGKQRKSEVKETAKIPKPDTLILEPAQQRCPKCAAVVSMSEDECGACGYTWGGFHPHSTTKVGPDPVRNRKHERHDMVLPLIYRSETLEVEAETRNLSQGGVFVCTRILDAPGTACTLTFLIDGGPPLVVSGQVTRVVRPHGGDDEAGLGVAFDELSESARSWIETSLRRQAAAAAAAEED